MIIQLTPTHEARLRRVRGGTWKCDIHGPHGLESTTYVASPDTVRKAREACSLPPYRRPATWVPVTVIAVVLALLAAVIGAGKVVAALLVFAFMVLLGAF